MIKWVKLLTCIIISFISILTLGKIIPVQGKAKVNTDTIDQPGEDIPDLTENKGSVNIDSILSYVERDGSLGYGRNYYYKVYDYDYYGSDDFAKHAFGIVVR